MNIFSAKLIFSPSSIEHQVETMPNRCCAYGCGKSYDQNVTLFRFPKDSEEFNKWEKQVQRTRSNWVAKPFSHLCNEHFGKECLEPRPSHLNKTLGNKGLKLKEGAVPTIFIRPPCRSCGGLGSSCPECTPRGKRQGLCISPRDCSIVCNTTTEAGYIIYINQIHVIH